MSCEKFWFDKGAKIWKIFLDVFARVGYLMDKKLDLVREETVKLTRDVIKC